MSDVHPHEIGIAVEPVLNGRFWPRIGYHEWLLRALSLSTDAADYDEVARAGRDLPRVQLRCLGDSRLGRRPTDHRRPQDRANCRSHAFVHRRLPDASVGACSSGLAYA